MDNKIRKYSPLNTMREILRDNSFLVLTVSRFGIAFGFGDETVGKICRQNNVDCNTFLTVCNLLSHYDYNSEEVSLQSLMDYLKRAHSTFLDVTLPKIRLHLIEAINHSINDDVTIVLMRFFDDYVEEVRKHMEHENNEVFEYVERLIGGKSDLEFSITDYSASHSHTVAKLNELKDIFIYHLKQTENPRLSATLFDIVTCEKDMMAHFEVENKLFIPSVKKLESKISNLNVSSKDLTCNNEGKTQAELLSEREKDIIRCVARGKSNKEIAEELFISTHTVTTHRRNINTKLGIHSSAALAVFAIINGLIDLSDINI